ncbi:EFR1 family ferrodoxin [Acidaminobacter sp. JC074]|uniref:EFR1 family ferrodoxin n=1 Tax=Acidaminobacter sp. JC074 TaxID=2530199 RepID=UPI001F1177C7|nr:EFR1 family ferrodoxin [Acidaminobacter sp. JC074]
MKVKGIYFSPTGTSKKVVESICKSLSSEVKYVDITLPKKRSVMTEIKEDLVVLGLPVYSGRIPLTVDGYIKSLVGHDTPCVVVAVYGNRDYDDALLEMKDIMKERGFKTLAAGAFIGVHSYTTQVAGGRPDTKDLEICREFAENIKEALNKEGDLKVKGKFPYKARKTASPIGPVIDERCLSCGICAINCPTGALIYNGKLKIDDTLCIKCNACVRKCPIEAISFGGKLDPFEKWLIENCSERKEPEYFTL